jgi:hypothetical protein
MATICNQPQDKASMATRQTRSSIPYVSLQFVRSHELLRKGTGYETRLPWQHPT